MAPAADPEQPESEIERILELLQRDKQLRDDLAVSCSRDEASLQMAEPSEPTEKLRLGEVCKTVGGRVANSRARVRIGQATHDPRPAVSKSCLIELEVLT